MTLRVSCSSACQARTLSPPGKKSSSSPTDAEAGGSGGPSLGDLPAQRRCRSLARLASPTGDGLARRGAPTLWALSHACGRPAFSLGARHGAETSTMCELLKAVPPARNAPRSNRRALVRSSQFNSCARCNSPPATGHTGASLSLLPGEGRRGDMAWPRLRWDTPSPTAVHRVPTVPCWGGSHLELRPSRALAVRFGRTQPSWGEQNSFSALETVDWHGNRPGRPSATVQAHAAGAPEVARAWSGQRRGVTLPATHRFACSAKKPLLRHPASRPGPQTQSLSARSWTGVGSAALTARSQPALRRSSGAPCRRDRGSCLSILVCH